MTKIMQVSRWPVVVLVAASTLFVGDAQAFLHDSGPHERHHGKGCFVTTSAVNHTRGIRHWRSPCPHQERRHLNPYHQGYHRLPRGH